jgi:hypothetical protein
MQRVVAETTVRATVEFVVGSDPVRGRIVRASAGDAPFVGWLGLLGLLEQVASLQSSEPGACERPQRDRPLAAERPAVPQPSNERNTHALPRNRQA